MHDESRYLSDRPRVLDDRPTSPSPRNHNSRALTRGGASGSTLPATNRIGHQVLVLDVSTSMGGACDPGVTKLDALKKSTITLLGVQARQQTGTRITLIVFNNDPSVICDAVVDADGHPRLVNAVKSMHADGGTDIAKALKLAGDSFDPDQFGAKQLTLLTDGGHNGSGDPRKIADDQRLRGISIATIGFGDDADEALLKDIATKQRGVPAYWHARDQQTLSKSLTDATRPLSP